MRQKEINRHKTIKLLPIPLSLQNELVVELILLRSPTKRILHPLYLDRFLSYCPTENGDIIIDLEKKCNQYGRRAVFKIGPFHCKWNPELIGLELAVGLLCQLIFGSCNNAPFVDVTRLLFPHAHHHPQQHAPHSPYLSTVSSTAPVTEVGDISSLGTHTSVAGEAPTVKSKVSTDCPQAPPPYGTPSPQHRSASSISTNSISTLPPATVKHEIFMFSESIRGPNLRDVLADVSQTEESLSMFYHQIDFQHFCQQVLWAIITNAEDGKPDNYICEEVFIPFHDVEVIERERKSRDSDYIQHDMQQFHSPPSHPHKGSETNKQKFSISISSSSSNSMSKRSNSQNSLQSNSSSTTLQMISKTLTAEVPLPSSLRDPTSLGDSKEVIKDGKGNSSWESMVSSSSTASSSTTTGSLLRKVPSSSTMHYGIRKKIRIIPIDNDHSFVAAMEDNLVFKNRPRVKVILFLLEPMRWPIDPLVRNLFLQLSPSKILTSWLNQLQEWHVSMNQPQYFIENERLGNRKNYPTKLSVSFAAGLPSVLYQKILLLQGEMKKNPNCTLLSLLKCAEPVLASHYYLQLVQNESPLVRFAALSKKQYKDGVTRTTSKEIEKVMAGRVKVKGVVSQQFSPAELLDHIKKINVDQLEKTNQKRRKEQNSVFMNAVITKALNAAQFEVRKPVNLVFFGRSGSGKSTIIQNIVDYSQNYIDLSRDRGSSSPPMREEVKSERSTSVLERNITLGTQRFKLVEVNMNDNTVTKLLHNFSDSQLLIFVVAMDEYDQFSEVLDLDFDEKANEKKNPTQTKLHEAIRLFEKIVNNMHCRDKGVLLLFTKIDLLEVKLKTSNFSFSDYSGNQTTNEIINFVKQKFRQANKNESRPLYTYFITSDEIEQIACRVFSICSKVVSAARNLQLPAKR